MSGRGVQYVRWEGGRGSSMSGRGVPPTRAHAVYQVQLSHYLSRLQTFPKCTREVASYTTDKKDCLYRGIPKHVPVECRCRAVEVDGWGSRGGWVGQ